MRFSLKTKLLVVIGLLGFVPIVGVALNTYSLSASRQASAQRDAAWHGVQYLEHINALVYATVMESRGIYMSPDWKTAEPFAKKLLADLDQIDATTKLWKADVVEAERGKIENMARDIDQFITFRRELVRLAKEDTTASARAYGDNDANRKVRSALNDKLDALSKDYAEHTAIAGLEAKRIVNVNAAILITLASLAVIALATGFSFVIRGLVRPLYALKNCLLQIAGGSLDLEVPGAARYDEIGEIAQAVSELRNAALEKGRIEQQQHAEMARQQAEEQRRIEAQAHAKAERERAALAEEQAAVVGSLAQGLKSLAEGNLTFRIGNSFAGAYEQIRLDFNLAADRLQETIRSIVEAARQIADAASEISDGTTDLSQRTEEQSAVLDKTAASMSEIATTVKQNADNAQHANQITTQTREMATRGSEVVRKTISSMSHIEESSRKIADIITVIDEIARQTNLLALNAAVEAARAGDAGRGFAVVASEVRSLAQRSSQAAKDIKTLITNSFGEVQEGVALANQAGAALDEVVASIKRAADVVAEIAQASSEQAGGLAQINTALSQIDESNQQNSALVEESAAAAKTLENQAAAMSAQVGFFRIESESDRGDHANGDVVGLVAARAADAVPRPVRQQARG
jgi:methyl-accepting chemotaxis protein